MKSITWLCLNSSLVTVLSLALTLPIHAATIDGVVSLGEYGPPLAVQDTPTGYGDTDGVFEFGSELNALYANNVLGGSLELAFTGNLEDGTGNSLVILLDVRAGGAVASTLTGGFGQLGSFGGQRTDDWGDDVDGGPGVTNTPGGSSILDPGFNPDISIEINAGGGFGEYFVNIIDLTLSNDTAADPDVDQSLGSNFLGGGATTQTYTRNDADASKGSGGQITHAFDNSNTAGVLAYDFGTPPGSLGDPLSAITGIELLLTSDFLAADAGHSIKFLPFISNTSGEFLSNQFLPGLGGVENLNNPGGLGGVPLFDAREFQGNQFIMIVPEPTTFALAGLGFLGVAFVRWKRL